MNRTKKQFELFKKEAQKWIEFFGLKEWRCEYEMGCNDDTRAEVEFDTSGRCATFYLTKKLKLSDYLVRESAFHEVCELLLADHYHHLRLHNVEKELVSTIQHSVIRRLENSVFKIC